MGERITFRERTEGVAVEAATFQTLQLDGGALIPLRMSASLCEPKIKFVEGEIAPFPDLDEPAETRLAACGPGTYYSLEVSPDELYEIYYRIRDAKIISGKATYKEDRIIFGQSATRTHTVEFSGGNPPDALYSSVGDIEDGEVNILNYRGYYYLSTDPDEENPFHFYLEDSYEVFDLYDEASYYIREINDREVGLWGAFPSRLGIDNGIFSRRLTGDDASIPQGVYAFMLSSITEGEGVGRSEEFMGDCEFYISSRPLVAYVDVDGSGNPMSESNRRFMAMEVALISDETSMDIRSNYNRRGEATLSPDLYLEIILANDRTVSLPLVNRYAMDFSAGLEFVSSENIKLKATKWWPYAHPNGSPVWNEDTGAYIPEDTGE